MNRIFNMYPANLLRYYLYRADCWSGHFAPAILVAAVMMLVAGTSLSLAASDVPAQTKDTKAGATLIMIDEEGCPYCERWHDEVGTVYSKTSEGKFAPLTVVSIWEAKSKGFKRVSFTPTFIVMSKGKEVGRILGYPGEDLFWGQLNELLSKIGYLAAVGPQSNPQKKNDKD